MKYSSIRKRKSPPQNLPERDVYGRRVLTLEQANGLLVARAWKKLGRRVKADAVPALVVERSCASTGLPFAVEYLRDCHTPVLADLGNDRYLIARRDGWWLGYSEEQTEEIPKKSRATKHQTKPCDFVGLSPDEINVAADAGNMEKPQTLTSSPPETAPITSNSFCLSLPSSPSPPPLRRYFLRKSSLDRELVPLLTEGEKPSVNNGRRAYVPHGLDRSEWPEEQRDAMTWIIHLLYFRRFSLTEDHEHLDKDDFICLKNDYLREVLGKGEAKVAKELLLRRGIIECDNQYIKGEKSYGYRFRDEALRRATHHLVSIDDPTIRKNVVRRHLERTAKPVHKWLWENLTRFRIDQGAALAEAERLANTDGKWEAYVGSIQAIVDGQYDFTVDEFSGRVHTNITRLKRELWKHLRVDGQPLVEIDIKNSQPTFLAVVADQNAVEDPRYTGLCEQGILYDWLAEQGGWARDEVKEQLMRKALFSKNKYTNPVKRLFVQVFPAIAGFLAMVKEKDHTKAAQLLQKTEAQFMIQGVCETVRKERPSTPVVTIHDSIVTIPDAGDYIKSVMEEEFRILHISPRLQVRPL